MIIGAAYTALFTTWIVVDIGGDVVTRAFDDFAIMVAAVVAGAVCLSTSRRADNGTNRSWLLLGLACETWAVGQCIWAVYQNVLGRPTPFPSLADVSYLAAIPLIAAAILIYPFNLQPVSRARSAVECSLIAMSLFFISWVSLLGPTWDAGAGPLLTQAVGVAYPLGNLTVGFLVIAKLARSPRSDRAPVLLIASGLLVLAVTQSTFIVLSLRGAYQTGSLIDSGYVVAFALIAVAASRSSPDARHAPRDSVAAPAAWMQVLPHLVGWTAVAAAVWVAQTRGITKFMIAALSAVALLSLIRQALLTRESRRAETALTEAASELAEAQRMEAVGQLAGGIAHEFNNLLMSVLGYGEVALAALPPGAPARRSLEAIGVAGARASELTKQLLVFGRQQGLETQAIDLNEVVRSAWLPGGLLEVDTPVDIVLEPRLPPVIAARAQIDQVLLHLVLNARDALASGDLLRITTSYYDPEAVGEARAPDQLPTGMYALLTVSDTSGGMDSDTAVRSMESFFTTEGDRQGKGLDLAMVYGIVIQLGGALTASPGEGCGSGFRVYLPCGTEAEIASRNSMRPATATTSV